MDLTNDEVIDPLALLALRMHKLGAKIMIQATTHGPALELCRASIGSTW